MIRARNEVAFTWLPILASDIYFWNTRIFVFLNSQQWDVEQASLPQFCNPYPLLSKNHSVTEAERGSGGHPVTLLNQGHLHPAVQQVFDHLQISRPLQTCSQEVKTEKYLSFLALLFGNAIIQTLIIN